MDKVEIARTALAAPNEMGASAPGSLSEAFTRIVAVHPQRIAAISDTWRLSYSELNATANRLAHAVLARTTAPTDRVSILMEHDVPAIAAILAVLKAGRMVVVLDPTHPIQRLQDLTGDAEPACIIADPAHIDTATRLLGDARKVVAFEEAAANGPSDDPRVTIEPDAVAYLVYTSGSTGRPKGVLKTHRQILADGAMHVAELGFCAHDRIPLFGALSHGQATIVMWAALMGGAALQPFAVMRRGMVGLSDWMTASGASAFVASASIFRSFASKLPSGFGFPSVRLVWLCSEPATSDDFALFDAHFGPQSIFAHSYASSETSNIGLSMLARGARVASGRLPMAVASKGQELLLLDEQGSPVAAGDIGEIAVKSRTLAAGYWRNPELTAEMFLAIPESAGMRLYRTGDLARINSEGLFEFVGRKGTRVKIRGNTIDLAEVEAALHALPAVGRAAADVVVRDGREPELVAYVAARSGHAASSSELRHALRGVLPAAMVPSHIVVLDELPTSGTGKVDRDRLRQLPIATSTDRPSEPQTATERMLSDLWAAEFGRKDVGRDDDFFDLGGDSLIGASLAAQIHAVTGVALNLEAIASHPTLAGLAQRIEQRGAEGESTPPLVRVARDQPLPLSSWEERIWVLSRDPEISARYTMARPYRLHGPLNKGALRECLDAMVQRHEILRTTYIARNGQPERVVHRSLPVSFREVDLTGETNQAAEAFCRREASIAFDLETGPLLSFVLIRLGANEHWLLRLAHHIIFDAGSLDTFFQELALLYDARLNERPLPLAERPFLQYADYAAWQRTALHPGDANDERCIEFWRETLADAPISFAFPFARPEREPGVDPAAGRMRWGLGHDILRGLNRIAKDAGATPFMIRLALFAALVAAETGVNDVVLGCYVTRRNRSELRDMLGYFTNLITLRLPFQPTLSYRDWLAVVRKQVLSAQAHGGLEYEILLNELLARGVRPPTINALFHMSKHNIDLEVAGLHIAALRRQETFMPWGFTMAHDANDEESDCRVLFDATLHEPAGVRRFLNRYRRLLAVCALGDPDQTMTSLLARSVPETPLQRAINWVRGNA